MKIIKKAWGHEIVLVSNELYSCKLMVIKGGYQCSIHYHKLKDETFMLLAGKVELSLNKAFPIDMTAFQTCRIAPGQKHSFAGYAPFSFVLEVATQDLPDDSYRETESGPIEKWSADDMINRC